MTQVVSEVSSSTGNIRGAKITNDNITAKTTAFKITVGLPGHFNAAAKETVAKRVKNICNFWGSRSKSLPPEVKAYVGLSVFCLLATLVAYFIDNQNLAFLCTGYILGPPLVLVLADTFFPREKKQ